MSMVKVVSPSGWEWDRPVALPLNISSRGLRGHDRREFLKYASHVFLPYIDQIKVAKDEVPVHLIALGASEAYGPNRNGDAFKEAACKAYHDTFVKFAKWYRNHKNKAHQGDPFYGYIKQSAYNDSMRRVELIAMLNAEKSAAERNGGYVADQELEKLAKDEDIPVSMACRVPYDECAHCGNKARTREEYCKAAACPAGGCFDNLTRLVKVAGDTQMVYVNNDHPTWFDMSKVWRPADRIAYGTKADYLTKAAADTLEKAAAAGGVFLGGGAKAAEDLGVTAPLPVLLASDLVLPGQYHAAVREQVKLAHGLALQEERMGGYGISPEVKRAFAAPVQGAIDLSAAGEPGTAKCAEFLAALADETILLPLRDFARLTKQADHVAGAAQALTGVYGRMVADGSIDRLVAGNPFAVHGKTAGQAARSFAARHKTAFSLEKEALDWRCKLSAVRRQPVPPANSVIWTEKQAADSPEAEELARSYALYKLAALHRIAARGGDFLLTTLASAVQNQVV